MTGLAQQRPTNQLAQPQSAIESAGEAIMRVGVRATRPDESEKERGKTERNATFNDKQSKNRRAKNWGATGARKKRGKNGYHTTKQPA